MNAWVGRVGLVVLCGAVLSPALAPDGARATASRRYQDDDIDAFMHKVLERRATNRDDLHKYTLRDREALEVTGPGGLSIESYHGEFIWYVREGYMIRSPHKLNGAAVGDAEREHAEQQFLARAKRREKRRAEKRERRDARAAEKEAAEVDAADAQFADSSEREYFLGFPFEAGNYYLAGREQLDGLDVVRIEYYPEKLFEDDVADDERDGESGQAAKEDAEDLVWERRFAKTSRVTLWVLPEAHQIIKVRFETEGFDFLPLSWLFHVDEVGGEMTMHRPFDDRDVWLPQKVTVSGNVAMATGAYAMAYELLYYDYKETEIGAKVRFLLPMGDIRQQSER